MVTKLNDKCEEWTTGKVWIKESGMYNDMITYGRRRKAAGLRGILRVEIRRKRRDPSEKAIRIR